MNSYEKVQALVALLAVRGWRISFAESCTGGMAAAALVDVPDASKVFDLSFVTYANQAKIKYVGVSEETVEQYGVVSEPVAAQMASGAAKAASAQVGVGISGVAGPSGGTEAKPVGTVCFGFFVDGTVTAKTVDFGNIGRNAVRQKSVDLVYDTLLQMLNN